MAEACCLVLYDPPAAFTDVQLVWLVTLWNVLIGRQKREKETSIWLARVHWRPHPSSRECSELVTKAKTKQQQQNKREKRLGVSRLATRLRPHQTTTSRAAASAEREAPLLFKRNTHVGKVIHESFKSCCTFLTARFPSRWNLQF